MSTQIINDWQARAVATYQHLQARIVATASAELAARLKSLIGRAIDPQAIYLDDDTHTAIMEVDGVLFRMRNQELVVVRACPNCGLGRYESAPIASAADLGFALGAWQPPCANCQAEDLQDI